MRIKGSNPFLSAIQQTLAISSINVITNLLKKGSEMLLRSTIEKCLPVREDEKELSEEARQIAFRGSYAWPNSEVIGASSRPNPHVQSDQDTWVNSIHRDRYSIFRIGIADSMHTAKQTRVKTPNTNATLELSTASTLRRVNRVETIARSIKFAGAAILTAASIAIYPGSEENPQPDSSVHGTTLEATSKLGS